MSIRTALIASGILAVTPTGYLLAQDAHVHGVAAINLVIEGDELEIEFESPAANIVGFEHAAESEKDKHAIEHAIEDLEDPTKMFGLPRSADCRQVESKAELHGNDSHDNHGHDEHKEAHDDDHGHDDHKDAHDDDHDGHDDHKEAHDHDHDKHEDHKDEHSEFHAHYHFDCDNPNELTSIALPLFESFPAVKEIRLQAITPWGQFGGDIEPQDAEIRLK